MRNQQQVLLFSKNFVEKQTSIRLPLLEKLMGRGMGCHAGQEKLEVNMMRKLLDLSWF